VPGASTSTVATGSTTPSIFTVVKMARASAATVTGEDAEPAVGLDVSREADDEVHAARPRRAAAATITRPELRKATCAVVRGDELLS